MSSVLGQLAGVAREIGAMPRSDPDLVKACLKGDEAAWNELISRYGRLVYAIPRRHGLSPADSDEVFQNVFTIALRQLATLRDRKLLAAWLITIAHRESQRYGKRVYTHSELDESMQDDGVAPEEEVENWERNLLVRQAISQLEDRCRELLTALFLNSETPRYQEIASRLGISVGSIGPIRARCFKKLEAILDEMGIDLNF